jgi:hypothetical protein
MTWQKRCHCLSSTAWADLPFCAFSSSPRSTTSMIVAPSVFANVRILCGTSPPFTPLFRALFVPFLQAVMPARYSKTAPAPPVLPGPCRFGLVLALVSSASSADRARAVPTVLRLRGTPVPRTARPGPGRPASIAGVFESCTTPRSHSGAVVIGFASCPPSQKYGSPF